jgi:hypothetical protein
MQILEMEIFNAVSTRKITANSIIVDLSTGATTWPGQIFSGQRIVIKNAGMPVSIPLARFVKRFKNIGEIITKITLPKITGRTWLLSNRKPAGRQRPP